MNRKTCSNCLYGDQCGSFNICDYFSPMDDADDIEAVIENGRQEFLDEWNEYISEYND